MRPSAFSLVLAGVFVVGGAGGFLLVDRINSAASSEQWPDFATGPLEAEAVVTDARSPRAAPMSAPRERSSVSEEIARIGALRDRDESSDEALWFGRACSLSELPAALREALALRSGHARWGLIASVFERWGELDPAGGLAALAALSNAGDRRNAEGAFYYAWAEHDPAGALASAREQPEGGNLMGSALRAVISSIAERDIAAAFAEANTVRGRVTRDRLRGAVVGMALEQGTGEALVHAIVAADGGAVDREDYLVFLFQQWGALDAEEPLRALALIDESSLTASATKGMLLGWAESDPVGAVEYGLNPGVDEGQAASLDEVLANALGRADAGETARIAGLLQEHSGVTRLSDRVLVQIARTQPELALELLSRQEDAQTRALDTGRIVSTWMGNNYLPAANYVDRLAETGLPRLVFARVSDLALRNGESQRVVQWLRGVPAHDRARAAQNLISVMQENQGRLSRDAVSLLADAILSVPDLNPDVRKFVHLMRAGNPAP